MFSQKVEVRPRLRKVGQVGKRRVPSEGEKKGRNGLVVTGSSLGSCFLNPFFPAGLKWNSTSRIHARGRWD